MRDSRQGGLLPGFLQALGFELEQDGPTLWARRVVAGERISSCFYWPETGDLQALRDGIKLLNKAARTEVGVTTYLVTAREIPPDIRGSASDFGVNVASELGYLNAALDSQRTCKEVVGAAARYIPEAEYVEQRLNPGDKTGSEFLREWATSEEGALFVILGQGGCGKTCLAHHLARRLAEEHLRDPSKPVPLLLPLHRHRYVRRFEELVLTHLQDHSIIGFTSKAFAFLVNNNRVIPILDGFDELAETGGISVARETLRGLIDQLEESAKVLLTSRQAYFRHQGDLSLVGDLNGFLSRLQTRELNLFDEEQRRVFLGGRGLAKEQIREIERCVRDAEQVLASPLILKILADEVKEGGKLQGATAAEILKRSLEKVCEREIPKQRAKWAVPLQVHYLTTLADLMNEAQVYELGDSDSWLADIVEPELPSELGGGRRREELVARVTQLKNHPLLTASVADGTDAIGFPHALYRDFFLAVHFLQGAADDSQLRRSLRLPLPDPTVEFLAQLLSEDEVQRIVGRGLEWRQGVRDVLRIALAKCDMASPNNVGIRTDRLGVYLGGAKNFDYQNLSGLHFRMLELKSFSFMAADFTGSSLQGCTLRECNFQGAQVAGAQFYECQADEATSEALRALGVSAVVVPRTFLAARVTVSNVEDPVVVLVGKFFQRFIRGERGQNQRTAKVESFFSGLGGEERKFTERELLPVMESAKIYG